jgi:hypothetical protein
MSFFRILEPHPEVQTEVIKIRQGDSRKILTGQ